jgi:hypothetical protein
MIVAAMGAAAAYVLGVAPARGQAGPGEKPPWTSQLKRFCLLPKNGIKTIDGWTGLMEDLCAPADEVESFTYGRGSVTSCSVPSRDHRERFICRPL